MDFFQIISQESGKLKLGRHGLDLLKDRLVIMNRHGFIIIKSDKMVKKGILLRYLIIPKSYGVILC